MKRIEGFNNYSIDAYGKVYAHHLGRFLSPYDNGLGYKAIKLLKDGRRHQMYIHRLVAVTFLGSVDGYDINHIDCNKSNNFVDNLEIVTTAQNPNTLLTINY